MEEKGQTELPDIDMGVIVQLNLDKYVNWVLNLKHPESDKQLEEAGRYLEQYECSQRTKKKFSSWRKIAFVTLAKTFDAWLDGGNPKPDHLVADEFGQHICESMSDAQCLIVATVEGGLIMRADYDLARVIGKLDFLIWLRKKYGNPRKPRAGSGDLAQMITPLTYAQVALLYRYDNKALDTKIAVKVLEKYPHLASGKDLIKKYNLFKSSRDRIGGLTKKQTEARKKDIRIAAKYLTTSKGKNQAKVELDELTKQALED